MPVSLETVLSINSAAAQGAKPPLLPSELDSFIAINTDGSVSAFFGKMDMGQGLFTAIGQIVAEELDVPFNQVKVIMGDTATSVNQGGASGSTGIQNGGKQMRAAAARSSANSQRNGGSKTRGATRQADRRRRHRSRAWRSRCSTHGHIRGLDRWPLLQYPARVEQADRKQPLCARQSEAKARQRNTKSSESPSPAKTSRQRFSRRKITSLTSKFRAWCTPD